MTRTVIASDSFAYSDGSLVTVSGGNWAASTLTGYQAAKVISGQVTGSSGGGEPDGAHRWTGAGTFTDDQFSSLVVATNPTGYSGQKQGVTVRGSADTDSGRDHYYFHLIDGENSLVDLRIGKWVNGVETNNLATANGVTITAGQRIELQAYGTTLRALIDGEPVLAVTDSSLTTGTPGITGAVGEAWRFDSWEGGNLSGSQIVTITRSIGTSSRQYSTPQAWEDACPADLTLLDVIYKGECYNDSEFTISSGQLLVASGTTTDTTRFLWLTTGAGQSFRDHANRLTNPLTYDQSKGVGFRSTVNNYTGGGSTLLFANRYSRLEGIQIYNDANGNGAAANVVQGWDTKIYNCIIKDRRSNTTFCAALGGTSSAYGGFEVVNTLIHSTNDSWMIITDNGVILPQFRNCTFIGDGAKPLTRMAYQTDLATFKNCAIFNWGDTLCTFGYFRSGSDRNATENASGTVPTNFGANSLTDLVFSDQFENTTSDFRVKAGSDLIGAGTRDQTYTNDLDIIGQARSTTAPTIGAWEFINNSRRPSRAIFI